MPSFQNFPNGRGMNKNTYDANNNNIVDNSEELNGEPASFYLSRTNHTGTQTASTISDLATSVLSTVNGEKGIANGIASLDSNGKVPNSQLPSSGSGSGDMVKSTYDPNDNGVVDNSEALGGQNAAYYLDRSNHTGTQLVSTISDFTSQVNSLINRGNANGTASLDGSGKIPSNQLPSIAVTDTFVVNSEGAMLALVAEVGDICVRTDLSKTFILRVEPASTLGNWTELATPASGIQSINGQSGTNVALTTTNINEGTNLYYTDTRVQTYLNANPQIQYASFVTVSSSRSLDLSDHDKTLLVTTTVTLTLPVLAQNVRVNIRLTGSGTVTFTALGATREPSSGSLSTQHKDVYAQFNTATNIWYLTGLV